ncbi:hypothetical protein COLO4_09403 [Corchorus olitorius]|uniref:Uncharacterized protein n=1 Tax=Corchorus olitorius TaxID=93759 RepID=A0A1R3KCD6_9ROSI|nr:hypothetical protein COLO4_09403 [Corchorus olitorius]
MVDEFGSCAAENVNVLLCMNHEFGSCAAKMHADD